jgi:triosephosphate isomerase
LGEKSESLKLFQANMKKLIIANWKMQLDYAASLSLGKQLAARLKAARPLQRRVVVCPEYPALPALAGIFKGTPITLGAQDSAAAYRGAYTGEVSPRNLKALGVKYVILGHSERREHLHENAAIINNKIKAALRERLIPILCIGEKLAEKKTGRTMTVLSDQLRRALKGVKLNNPKELIIAYEPIWAISPGKPLDSAGAEKIQTAVGRLAAKILKQPVVVIYGGSAAGQNAAAFLKQPSIGGLLVGAASTRLEEFLTMVRN